NGIVRSVPRLWIMARLAIGLAGGILAVAVVGCGGITVRKADQSGLLGAWKASVSAAGDLSPRTLQTLHRFDLEQSYRRAPLQAYAALQAVAVQAPEPEVLFALAEICYVLGRDAERHENSEACAFYYHCAGYAYHFLFDTPPANDLGLRPVPQKGAPAAFAAPNAFDPRFRLACDLYNAGLAKCIRAAQRVGRLDPRQQLQLPTPDGHGFKLSVVHEGFAWKPEEFGPLLFCSDFEVVGLANNYRGYGLGVPLIATRTASSPEPSSAFYPREVSFPVTAFFRYEGSVADLSARRAGRLELYNPFAVQTVTVAGRSVPLETDLTTPLAYFLSRSDLNGIEYTGFLRAHDLRDRTGIYMFEPYQPGKIPVLMIHGLLSSPLTWAPMFNDLRADPTLRDKYQFWFYLYPTGNPYLATAADLRQALTKLRADLDPRHEDAALDRMVFVGHSMGGLVSKLLTEDSGDAFWRLVSSEPLDSAKLVPEGKAELQRVFYFEHEPSVRRVIFLGTPHHGSKLSPSPPARLLNKLVKLPNTLMKVTQDLSQANPKALPALRNGLPTSVDLLAPDAPALQILASRPTPGGVHFHSIVGVVAKTNSVTDLALGTFADSDQGDGIVPYASAHIDGVDSEVVVPADHFHVHHHPTAVTEVKRILFDHLREGQVIQPVSAGTR
ncbi:MAG TPA: hypothetical protein VKI65_21130, partial [Gemmataceae bacterium]|nr:hypothetical protein [Gemmataceae bacterium]